MARLTLILTALTLVLAGCGREELQGDLPVRSGPQTQNPNITPGT